MVVEPEIFDFLKSDNDILEVDVLEKIAKKKNCLHTNIMDFGNVWMLER